MTANTTKFWKQLWQWTTSGNLSATEYSAVIGSKEITECLKLGLASYKQLKHNSFSELQSKYPDQTKLLSITQILQNYIDVDTFQTWDIIKNYLCDISYGTPANALKNVTFVDTRPSFLLPRIWKFYHAERLFLLKLLLYIVEFKEDPNHAYKVQFHKIITNMGVQELKNSLLDQFEKLLNAAPPPRKIHKEFSSDTARQEWAEANLREQLVILQILLLIANENPLNDVEFKKLFELFRKHSFGKTQSFNDLLEERHRENCMKIMFIEVSLFLLVTDKQKISNVTFWLDNTKQLVEGELTKLQLNEEHSPMLLSWMLLTLESKDYLKLFESQYQHYGATALRLSVFEFLNQMLNSAIFSDNSKCSLVVRQRVFSMLNEMCDKFDGDGTIGHQNGAMKLAAHLLQTPDIAGQFWNLHMKEENCGIVSLWNTALEFFPFNFTSLSVMAAGLAKAGKCSVQNLLEELKNLPVYSEFYNPNLVPVTKLSMNSDDVLVGRDYYPLSSLTYKVEAGSRAALIDRKDGTWIHYRTPYSYWTIFNDVIERALGHHQSNLSGILQKVYEGTIVLNEVMKVLVKDKEVPKYLMGPCEGVFATLIRYMRAESPPLPLLVSCLNVSSALVPLFHKEIHLRLINTGLLPRLVRAQLSPAEYANGISLEPGAAGSYLVTLEQPTGIYNFLAAYIDLLCGFCQVSQDDRLLLDIVLPGLVFLLREVFPNVCGWRYAAYPDRRKLLQRCINVLFNTLQHPKVSTESELLVQKTCVYALLQTENALELLKIVAVGNEQLELMMYDESNWISGSGSEYLKTVQKAFSVLMLALKLKTLVNNSNEITPIEHLIFAQNKQKDALKVVPRVTSYINHAFNKNLSILCCRLLTRFATEFQMSLFSCLEMTAYQVRVMFLDRLQDKHEDQELKIAILEFVAACVGKQPGLTEAFFNMKHITKTEKDDKSDKTTIQDNNDEGILMYMAEYLGTINADVALLHSPLLGCIMALFHALWKNNMQVLVKELRESSNFWEQLTSPLFNIIQPGLRSYAQIFNVLGIELFVSRGTIDPSLKKMLEMFFDTDKKYLDDWIKFIYSFDGRRDEDEAIDRVPVWLGLLTSWKDFTTIFCKCLPICLNIAHKAKMVKLCLTTLLQELKNLKDGRLVVILAELYVIMLANWKDDCFENRKAIAIEIGGMLSNTAIVYECLHPRAKRAILSIGTVSISSLDYEIKANSTVAQSIIRAVTDINSVELEALFDHMNDVPKSEPIVNGHNVNEDIAPIVLALAMVEQCLELYDAMFTGLDRWFQSTMFINKLLCCLQNCLQNRIHYHTSLAALRCLITYSRGPFSKDLLVSDVGQFLWLQLLPPKFDMSDLKASWKPAEWWKVYAHSMDFISMMVMKHGQFFANSAITFVGVHLEHLVEAILMPGQVVNMDSLNLCAATLNLVLQLMKYESRWRIENLNSLVTIMRSISTCLCQCVILALRARRPDVVAAPAAPSTPALDDSSAVVSLQHTPTLLNRILELLHMASLCLCAWSPPLLTLLADPVPVSGPLLVELHFGAPKISYETATAPELSFGTLLAAVCLLTKTLNHSYHAEDSSGSRSPRARRRACSCATGGGSPGGGRSGRSESLTSLSSGTSAAAGLWPLLNERLVAGALDASITLLASQALVVVRNPHVATRHKQLVRRELSSELTIYHDFVRKRVLCATHMRPHLLRHKLGAWPLAQDEDEVEKLEKARDSSSDADSKLPPPPPPKRAANDSMREYILRKHYLDKCAQTPIKEPPSPVSHSTPTSERKGSKRVSWAETAPDSDEGESPPDAAAPYTPLTDVQLNNDEDYFHFMSLVFLYICQNDL